MEQKSVRDSAVEAITAWSSTGRRAPKSATPVCQLFGMNVFSDDVMQTRLPEKVYKTLRNTIKKGRAARPVDRRRRRDGHEGLGDRAGRDALHALVPADDRPDGREARLVPVARPTTARRSPSSAARNWSGASPTRRASPRAACAPPSRPAATRRGTRPARRSSSTTPTARRCASPRRSVVDRRGARQEDAAAALDGGPLAAGRPHPEAVRLGGQPRSTPRPAPSRNTS